MDAENQILKRKAVSQNEDFIRADIITFRSKVKDLNKQYIAITFFLAPYYTQINNSSILETK